MGIFSMAEVCALLECLTSLLFRCPKPLFSTVQSSTFSGNNFLNNCKIGYSCQVCVGSNIAKNHSSGLYEVVSDHY